MATMKVTQKVFKDKESLQRLSCSECCSVLDNPVQITCGHRLCKACADVLIAAGTSPRCPECKEEIEEEDGVKVNKKNTTWIYTHAWLQ